jgi:hypothetical protein
MRTLARIPIPRLPVALGAFLVAGVGLTAAAAPAFAAQDPVLTPEQQSTLQAQVDAYQACLEGQGVTLPERPAGGEKPEITDEQRSAMRAARDTCADQRPDRPDLSEEQRATLQAQSEEYRACTSEELSAAGITKPERPAEGSTTGERPARPVLTDEQKAAFEAARTACEDLRPNLGVDGLGPMGRGPGGPGGPGGRGFGGPDGRGGSGSSTAETTSAVI